MAGQVAGVFVPSPAFVLLRCVLPERKHLLLCHLLLTGPQSRAACTLCVLSLCALRLRPPTVPLATAISLGFV